MTIFESSRIQGDKDNKKQRRNNKSELTVACSTNTTPCNVDMPITYEYINVLKTKVLLETVTFT